MEGRVPLNAVVDDPTRLFWRGSIPLFRLQRARAKVSQLTSLFLTILKCQT